MPDPVLLALVHVLVLEEKRTLASKQWDKAPEEEQSEDVERPEADKATENENEFVVWQLAIVEPHTD